MLPVFLQFRYDMKWRYLFLFSLVIAISPLQGSAQRTYSSSSVLATGNWFRIGLKQEGVYKVDVSLLSSLGISTSNLPSASIRLYGNGGGMLDEDNRMTRADDLVENPIMVEDGGDGIFNNADYFLFYAPGPDRWEKDSVNQLFRHRKNLYADTVYYYLSIGGQGKRILQAPSQNNPTIIVNSYDARFFYEKDLVNLLNSGKEWYGENFSNSPGGSLNRTFTVDWPGLLLSSQVTLVVDVAARSVGTTASFAVNVNGNFLQNINLPGVTGNFLDLYATAVTQKISFNTSRSNIAVNLQFNQAANGAQGWLNWFELFGRRALSMDPGSALFFRDWKSISPGTIAGFQINNSSMGVRVWEITDPLSPISIPVSTAGTQSVFNRDASRLREYIAFNLSAAIQPFALGKVDNQDLHKSSFAEFLIVTEESLLTEAQRLAQFHREKDGYQTVVTTVSKVFNEFSGGVKDPSAIRDFVKMYYDRAGNDSSRKPKYLLLFGSASYDYRNRISGNVNLVPGYESVNSLDPLTTYTSDDFFGLLDDTEDINQPNNSATIDIGIGRIPARNPVEAKTMVDKIIRYGSAKSFGSWRNQSVYVADDQDNNLHLNDAELISANANSVNPIINQTKIYLDAFPLVSGSGGARYPAVNEAIINQVFNGTLLFNYSGHGNYQRLADEVILSQEELNRFNNPDKLPLFITASCDFAPHDDPLKNSLGAGILTGNNNGAIALLTTTRLVFAYSNRVINDNYLKVALQPTSNGKYLTLGESVRQTKNITSQNFGDVLNNRKFTLLGDPAMRLAFPELRLQLDSVNNQPIITADTLRALGKYTFKGRVLDGLGNPVNDFNGTLQETIYDKAGLVKTLGNDVKSPVTAFSQQSGVLYKGNSTIIDGRFSFTFILPKDISFQTGRGRISLYADDGKKDANGVNNTLYIGGLGSVLTDNTGPVIKPYLNDDKFLNGGLTSENAILLVKLYDSSGINTSGNGIGHDITAIIDGNERNVMVLNNFYTAIKDSYQEGQVLFPLPTLTPGKHTIKIKAWDVANNSSEVTLDCVVGKQSQLQIANLRNFPNPFSVSTSFAFEHNQPNKDLDVTVNIYTGSGALVRRIHRLVNTGGTRNCQINWEGDNQSGAKMAKGIYIYHIIVATGDSKVEETRQLIVF